MSQPINRAAIEAASRYTNPAHSPVEWLPGGFTLHQGIQRFEFQLIGQQGRSRHHASEDLSRFQDCWELSAVTAGMSISPFFGELFGLPELAKKMKATLRQGHSYEIDCIHIDIGQLRFSQQHWITVIIQRHGEGELLLLGGIPAGTLTYPNKVMMAYQHLSNRELARMGIPRLSPEEQLPTVWSPTEEAITQISHGLAAGKGAQDFLMASWVPPFDSTVGNVSYEVMQHRYQRHTKHLELLERTKKVD